MKVIWTLLTALGLMVLAPGSLGATEAAHAESLARFQPGTWVGKGTISGLASDGRLSSRFRGPLTFALEVDSTQQVAGSGSWKLRRFAGRETRGGRALSATLKGWAAVELAGTASNVTISGTLYVIGEVTSPRLLLPLRVETPLEGRLVVTHAGRCKLAGSARLTTGATLRWNATRKGAVCNA